MDTPLVYLLSPGVPHTSLPPAILSLAAVHGMKCYQVDDPEYPTAQTPVQAHYWQKDHWVRGKKSVWGEFVNELEQGPTEAPHGRAIVVFPDESLHNWISELHHLRQRLVTQRGHIPFLVLPQRFTQLLDESYSERSTIIEQGIQSRLKTLLGGSDGPILLEGRTGSGKTEIARLIHNTLRRKGIFRVVNASTLGGQQGQIREGLFRGIKKNAFTNVAGARSLFEDCNNGTVLLDDFQDYPLEDQAPLLDMIRPLSNATSAYHLGETKDPWHADVQILIAVNKNRDELLREGRLRKDLHFRVRRTFQLPSLAEIIRGAGIASEALLRNYILCMQERSLCSFLKFPAEDFDLSVRRTLYLESQPDIQIPAAPARWSGGTRSLAWASIPAKALSYHWPGNFRELENLAVTLLETTRTIGVWSPDAFLSALDATMQSSRHLAPETADIAYSASPQPPTNPAELLARAHVQALEMNRTMRAAAAALFIDVRTLRQRVHLMARREWFLGSEQRHDRDASEFISPMAVDQLQSAAERHISRNSAPP